MFKGIKKKLTANRSNGRNRLFGGGRDMGESPPREPPERGGTKPISPRQIHPSEQMAPLPYSHRSIERSRTAPMKSGRENMVSRLDSHPYGAQRHTLQGPAYPTAPNICVTGGKIEFVNPTCSPISSEVSVNSSWTNTVSPCRKEYISPKRQPYSPRNFRKKEVSNYLTSPKVGQQPTNVNSRPPFSIYSSSEFKNSSPTSSSTSRSSRRKGRLERNRNTYDSKSNSMMQYSLPPKSPDTTKEKSATMPIKEQKNELEVLKQENSHFKGQLFLMKKELSKVENKVTYLQKEKNERSLEEDRTSKEQLSQYQNIVDRCNALEQANEQLQQEAQSQRQEYEQCLDNVALQVVQAIIVQKKQQEECERLSKKVQVLQKQNNNLSSLLANKAKSMSPSYAQQAECYEVLGHNSRSLPTTLKKENKKSCKDSSSNDSELSQSSDENCQSKLELTDPIDKCDTACWYDVIKSINNGDSNKGSAGPQPMKFQSTSNSEPIPSKHVQTDLHSSSSQTRVIASHPNGAYTQSSNHQQVIVNSLTSCITSHLPPSIHAIPNANTTIVNKALNKLPFINHAEKSVTDGIIKDEGYSTMSSDVQTEPKVSVSTIATVEEEKVKVTDSDTETEKLESPTRPEYVDGLRVVYDDEDTSSDVFLIAIHDSKNGGLLPLKSADVCRSLSESDLSTTSIIDKSFLQPEDLDNSSLPYFSMNKKNLINLQLKSFKNRDISKRVRNGRNHEMNAFSLDRDVNRPKLNSAHDVNSNSPSTYSHAEMEDWSLELSAEDLSTAADSIISGHPSHRESSTFELDQPELSWTVGNFSERTLDWQYEKSPNKTWLNNNSHCLTSPKSGCSDQPAVWSSVEHLSSCSDIASKSSTDIENFCDQLCKLPELKRLSCSSVDRNQEYLYNQINCSETGSLEDNLESNEDMGLDNVFTRDFYRLIKFESTRSLTESSKSLVQSETSQTLDRLKSRDSSINKTFTSVLGFIAEQQKYCKQRELLDQRATFEIVSSLESKCSNNNKDTYNQTFVMDNIFNSNTTPTKPKRSTSLHLPNGYVKSKGTLPSVPSIPSPPSRTTSRVTLPRHSIHSQHSSIIENVLPTRQSSQDILPMKQPPIPPHGLSMLPLLSERSSGNLYDSPPIPQRVTSRALPIPPNRPTTRPSIKTLKPSGLAPAVPNEDRQVPPRSTSLAHDRFQRSNSLQTPVPHKGKGRHSCGDIAPNCKTSQTLMIHLKKMAQDEDESNNERSSPDHSPEEIGLNTGWVRVAPFTDFTDSKNRANFMENMMPSSEAGSSETEDDSSRTRPQEHFLKTAQRNRRRKKVLRHREDAFTCPSSTRFDSEEKNALYSFHFLDTLSSSSEEPVDPQHSPGSKFNENLDSLRSSELCDLTPTGGDSDISDYSVPPSMGVPPTLVNIGPTKVPSSAVTFNPQGESHRPSIMSNTRPSNVTFRTFNETNTRPTIRPSSVTVSSCSAKYARGTPRPSSGNFKPYIASNSTGTNKPCNVTFNLSNFNSEPIKIVSDPLNVAYKYSVPLNVTYKHSSTGSNPSNNSASEAIDTPNNTDIPSIDAGDLDKTQVFERKNSLVFRIKEAFERSNWQPKNVIKSGYEKERLKSPNVKAVIEKFSKSNNELLPISIYSNKNIENVNNGKDEAMDATYIIGNRNKSNKLNQKEKNLAPKASLPKEKYAHKKIQTNGKPAKIPIFNIKIGKKAAAFSSDKGRLSISDSCGEVFSPLSSEDEEVFRKSYFH